MTRSGDVGFAVLYRWRLHPGTDEAFIEGWSRVTRGLLAKGALGSRLHRGPDGLWYAYAQWPSAEVRARVFAEPPGDPEASALMQSAVAERLPEIVLEPVADLLVLPDRS
jgi:hypothetical protein